MCHDFAPLGMTTAFRELLYQNNTILYVFWNLLEEDLKKKNPAATTRIKLVFKLRYMITHLKSHFACKNERLLTQVSILFPSFPEVMCQSKQDDSTYIILD